MPVLKHVVLSILLAITVFRATAQSCDSLGQTPSSAFPVCGTDIIRPGIVSVCMGTPLPGPCASYGVRSKNSYWYKFTCFSSGSLGFTIQPDDPNDDYNWQLFDIAGHDPEDVFTDSSLFVACNWSGITGNTGASSSGSGYANCTGNSYPAFGSMPPILQGHSYLLLISCYTSSATSQNSFELSFGGGTASIINPIEPAVLIAEASCDGLQVKVKFNKKIKCSSIDSSGKDFKLIGPLEAVSAEGIGCAAGFETDSVILQLDGIIIPGNKALLIKKGKDKNTILDNCDRAIPDSSSIAFEVYERQATPLDSILPVKCDPKHIEIGFNKNIRCSSIDTSGSDFFITGPYTVKVKAADGRCLNGVTKIIKLEFNKELETAGAFTLHLRKGRDRNSIIDECGEETVVPASIDFFVKDTVSADFTYSLTENCRNDVIALVNNGGNDINNWAWTVDSEPYSALQSPSFTFTTYGSKTIQLVVTNGFCADTVTETIVFPHDSLMALFTGPGLNCPNEIATFTEASTGDIVAWNWQFGNGRSSTLQDPPVQTYYTNQKEQLFPVSLAVKNIKNCYDTAVHYIKVVSNCYIAVPTAFTPNKDGTNDYLYPLNAYKASALRFTIHNKYGQKIFETADWTNKWDGTVNGQPQPSGVYIWMLQYQDEGGKNMFLRGTTVLMR